MRSVSLLLIVVGLGVGGCSVNPATGRTQLILISPQQVLAMSDAAATEVVAQHGGEIESPPLRAYVDRVGQGLAQRTEIEFRDAHDWTFTIVDSDEINAFALPGGKVYLSRGLLQRFTNEAQVAAVLGHEIGHVTARHVDERLSQVALAQLGLGALGEATESQLALVVVSMVTQGTLLRFGRDQEREADIQGLKYMTAAGYDPDAMLEVLQILADASTGPRPPEFLSTHPHPESRLRTVRGLLDGPYHHTRNNPAFRKYRRRFQEEAAPYLSPPRLAERAPTAPP